MNIDKTVKFIDPGKKEDHYDFDFWASLSLKERAERHWSLIDNYFNQVVTSDDRKALRREITFREPK